MTGSVRGYVVRACGRRPIRDASVVVLGGPAPAPDMSPLTNEDGWFAFDGLAEGQWRLAARGPNSEAGETLVQIYDDSVTEVTIEADEPASPPSKR